jgi:hypothetical protein
MFSFFLKSTLDRRSKSQSAVGTGAYVRQMFIHQASLRLGEFEVVEELCQVLWGEFNFIFPVFCCGHFF